MQTDISSRLCGQCHVDTFAEWETSQHGQEELTCARCHNPHSNELRLGSMQDTCRTCHKEETHFFTFTAHAEEGLLCTDCHCKPKASRWEMGIANIPTPSPLARIPVQSAITMRCTSQETLRQKPLGN